MPIYEYQCNRCRQVTEALQKFSDPGLTECPHCNGRLKKLMSLNSFHLKGNGWYVTDYASKGSTGGEKKESPAKDKSATSKETKSTSDTTKKTSSTTKEKKAKD